jgi:allantoicase
MDVYPDGGMARLRLSGALTETGRRALILRWFNRLPKTQAIAVLAALSPADAEALVTARPVDVVPQALL